MVARPLDQCCIIRPLIITINSFYQILRVKRVGRRTRWDGCIYRLSFHTCWIKIWQTLCKKYGPSTTTTDYQFWAQMEKVSLLQAIVQSGIISLVQVGGSHVLLKTDMIETIKVETSLYIVVDSY